MWYPGQPAPQDLPWPGATADVAPSSEIAGAYDPATGGRLGAGTLPWAATPPTGVSNITAPPPVNPNPPPGTGSFGSPPGGVSNTTAEDTWRPPDHPGPWQPGVGNFARQQNWRNAGLGQRIGGAVFNQQPQQGPAPYSSSFLGMGF